MKKSFFYKLICAICLLFTLLFTSSTFATNYQIPSDSTLDFYNRNGIRWYNPVGNVNCTPALGAFTGISSAGLSDLQAAWVDKYHALAEQLTVEYGIPWETVMAQGIIESTKPGSGEPGTSDLAVNNNNFFGIGAWAGHEANYYDNSTEGWRGYYNNIQTTDTYRLHGVFQQSGPYGDTITNPYNYLTAIKAAGYATDVDYISKVSGLIPAIENRAEQNGWLSSAELAVKFPEMLEHAATNAAGANFSGGNTASTSSYNSFGCVAAGSGSINATAIELSWPDRTHDKDDPKPIYAEALEQVGSVAWGQSIGDPDVIGGYSCDIFVSTVLRYSGVDPDVQRTGPSLMWDYFRSHPELYEEIPGPVDPADIAPGDIRVSQQHIEIIVQLDDGTYRIASASHSGTNSSGRTADHASGYYITGTNMVDYSIFRLKASATGSGGTTSTSGDNVKITIPGLQNTYKIAWVSDLHLMVDSSDYDASDPNTNGGARSTVVFQDGNTVNRLNSIISSLNNGSYDAIVFGGDLMDQNTNGNYQALASAIGSLNNPNVMVLISDHDAATDLLKSGAGGSQSLNNLGTVDPGSDLKVLQLGGGELTLIGLTNSTSGSTISSNLSALSSALSSATNALYFTHVPSESQTDTTNMQQWTLSSEADGGTGHGSVYFWSASADKYRDPGGYLDTLYNAGSLRGLFAGHTHHSRTFSFTNNSSIHVFGPAYKGIIGTITVSGS